VLCSFYHTFKEIKKEEKVLISFFILMNKVLK